MPTKKRMVFKFLKMANCLPVDYGKVFGNDIITSIISLTVNQQLIFTRNNSVFISNRIQSTIGNQTFQRTSKSMKR
jgi:hypothetical protein